MLPFKDNIRTRSFPLVTVALAATNLLIWLWERTGSLDAHIERYSYYPCSLVGSCLNQAGRHMPWYEALFTSMFMHAHWLHLGGNMLFLLVFGRAVEDRLGRMRFLTFYLVGGMAATMLQTLVALTASSRGDADVPHLGASGAIAAVLGAYLVLLPRARVLTLLFGFLLREIPALWLIGVWFALQVVEGVVGLAEPFEGGGVAYFAHVGGFVFGLATSAAVGRGTWTRAGSPLPSSAS